MRHISLWEKKLNKLYPEVYQYFTWDNSVRVWGKPFVPDSIIHSGKSVYLYLQKNSDSLYSQTIRRFFKDVKGFRVKKKLIFHNPQNKEAIIQLFFTNTAKTINPENK